MVRRHPRVRLFPRRRPETPSLSTAHQPGPAAKADNIPAAPGWRVDATILTGPLPAGLAECRGASARAGGRPPRRPICAPCDLPADRLQPRRPRPKWTTCPLTGRVGRLFHAGTHPGRNRPAARHNATIRDRYYGHRLMSTTPEAVHHLSRLKNAQRKAPRLHHKPDDEILAPARRR